MRLSDIAPSHVLIGMAHLCVCLCVCEYSTVQYSTVHYVRKTLLLRASLGLAARHGSVQRGAIQYIGLCAELCAHFRAIPTVRS